MPAVNQVFAGSTLNFTALDTLEDITCPADKTFFKEVVLSKNEATKETLQDKTESLGKQNMDTFNNRYVEMDKMFAAWNYGGDEPTVLAGLSGVETSADVWAVWLCLMLNYSLGYILEVIANTISVGTERDEEGNVIYDGQNAAYPYGMYRLLAMALLCEALQPVMGIGPGFFPRASS
jgi:hypothetical protein